MAWKWMAAAGIVAAGLATAAVVVTQAPAARQDAPVPGEIAEAPLDAEQVVAARQETMRRMEAVWLLLSDMIQRDDEIDRAAAAEGAGILAALFDEVGRQYPEGSFVPPSEALPDVRKDWSAFLALTAEAEDRARDLAEALENGSIEEARDLLAAVEKDCSSCHLRFSPGIRTDLRPWPENRP
ncbi:c-type cytochrome [Novispirillum sp. DQ9]|uniref:c-type cytochrome n=1 Tax=Novispirillum sp. DQ9 TaxID=3398612 RepID=UPI003C7C1119